MYPREIVLKEDAYTEKVAQYYTRGSEKSLNQYRTKQWPMPQMNKGNKEQGLTCRNQISTGVKSGQCK